MTGDPNNKENNKENNNDNDTTEQTEQTEQTDSILEVKNDESGSLTDQAETESVESKKNTKPAFVRLKLLLLLLAILSATLATAAYFTWQYWQQQKQHLAHLEKEISSYDNKLQQQNLQHTTIANTQAKELELVQQHLANLESQAEKNQLDRSNIQQRLDKHAQRLRALAGASRDDWFLSEARYLLRMASQRLLVEHRTEGAQTLLESAGNTLSYVSSRDIQMVREAIASEVISLKLSKKVDRQGIYARLTELKLQIQSLPKLPLSTLKEKESTNKDSDGQISNEAWYLRAWLSIKGTLGQLVEVRTHDPAQEILLSQQQKSQLLNSLVLMLEQARFALLHEEESIYADSLQQALDWWQMHFVHYAEYDGIKTELRHLQSTPIVQQLPSISRSSKLLTAYIERFHELNNQTNTGKDIEGVNQ